MGKGLTVRYGLHLLSYWAAFAGIVSFATTFLLSRGFSASQVGILLACGSFASCAVQPLLAAYADRAGRNVLPAMLLSAFALIAALFGLIALAPLPKPVLATLFFLAYMLFDAIFPLNNSISVYYNQRGYTINYGLGRAVGSLSCSLSALCLGRLIRRFGADSMLWVVMALLAFGMAVIWGYPEQRGAQAKSSGPAGKSCSVGAFFLRYRWYCLSLVGILLLAAFYAMADNYMIAVMQRLGGDSSSVGVAVAIATASATPVFVLFSHIRARITDNWILRISALSFLLRAVLLLLAGSVTQVYLIQLLQMTSYAFYSPVQLYYAAKKVAPEDMVKGQAFITSAYALGAGLGSLLGGQLLERLGITAVLAAGVALAGAGALVLFATVDREDRFAKQ